MISVNAKFWIWITNALGYNTPKVKRISELYDDVSMFYCGGEKEWKFCGIFSTKEISKLKKARLEDAVELINTTEKYGYSIIAIDDEKYPRCLYNIDTPPAVIYVNGNLPDIDNRLSIGIVGTRKATQYGISNSYKFGYALAKYGVATVSGGALGVDCASHNGTLAADGVTICVLGCGINCDYLSKNAKMRQAITKRGAVISEYPPDEPVQRYYFPARNRIISALSDGVLVIEAGAKSGSLITVNLALEQGKEVFALLGNNSPQNEGSNNRIKEGTAIPVTDFMDILNSFDNLYVTGDNVDVDFDEISLDDINAVPVKASGRLNKKAVSKTLNSNTTDNISRNNNNIENKAEAVKTKENIPAQKREHKENLNLNPLAQRIYEYISDEPIHIDKISADLQIPIFKVLSAVTILEMNGLIEALQGRMYILK